MAKASCDRSSRDDGLAGPQARQNVAAEAQEHQHPTNQDMPACKGNAGGSGGCQAVHATVTSTKSAENAYDRLH